MTNELLREIIEVEITDDLWKRLEALYIKMSLTNRLFFKQRLYTFKMEEGMSLNKQLDQFNDIIMN